MNLKINKMHKNIIETVNFPLTKNDFRAKRLHQSAQPFIGQKSAPFRNQSPNGGLFDEMALMLLHSTQCTEVSPLCVELSDSIFVFSTLIHMILFSLNQYDSIMYIHAVLKGKLNDSSRCNVFLFRH